MMKMMMKLSTCPRATIRLSSSLSLKLSPIKMEIILVIKDDADIGDAYKEDMGDKIEVKISDEKERVLRVLRDVKNILKKKTLTKMRI